jgi:glutamate synthase domain-containing protein 3
MLIEAHVANTESERGKMILEEWDTYLPKFVQLVTQGMKMKAAADAVAAAAAEAGKVVPTEAAPGSPREAVLATKS